MKLIVAGGRDYVGTVGDAKRLDQLNIDEIVSGGATGADAFGEKYAKARGIPCVTFKANWAEHGRGAGPIRNREMAQYADAVFLLPGGRGTASMRREAEQAGIAVYV